MLYGLLAGLAVASITGGTIAVMWARDQVAQARGTQQTVDRLVDEKHTLQDELQHANDEAKEARRVAVEWRTTAENLTKMNDRLLDATIGTNTDPPAEPETGTQDEYATRDEIEAAYEDWTDTLIGPTSDEPGVPRPPAGLEGIEPAVEPT